MDQFASLHGKAGHLINWIAGVWNMNTYLLISPIFSIVLVNTMVSHSLASSEYNLRRQQCEAGVAILRKYDPSIHSFGMLRRRLLEAHRGELDETVYKRCRFIVEENQRLLRGCDFLKQS